MDDGETKRVSKKTNINELSKETRKNHIVNGKTYTQIGRLFTLETTDK